MKRVYTLKHMALITVIVGILVIGCMMFVQKLGQRLYDTTVNAELELADAELSRIALNMENVQMSLRQSILKEDVINGMRKPGTLEFISSLDQFTSNFSIVKMLYGANYNFALYDLSGSSYYELFGVDLDAEIYSRIKAGFCEKLSGFVRNGYWYRTEYDGNAIDYCIYIYDGFAMIGWVLEDRLLSGFDDIPLGRNGFVRMIDREEGKIEGIEIRHTNISRIFDLTQNSGEFMAEVEIVGNATIFKIMMSQYAVLGLMGALLMLLIMLVWYAYKGVLEPMKKVLAGLTAYQNENSAEKIEEMVSQVELTEANSVLDNILKTMKGLKVQLYEKELNENRLLLDQNKLQLDYMQLQLQPHFLINCLNMVYSMVTAGVSDVAMNMISYMADYYRYSSRECFHEIALERELQRTENYIKIQQTWKSEEIQYDINVHVNGKYRLPPMSIMTFVENAVKYGLKRGRCLRIEIKVWEEDTSLMIQIRNSGDGFPREVMDEIEENGGLSSVEGHRTGITNTMKRLRMMYQERMQFRLFNDAFGANVRIEIPLLNDSVVG